MHNGASVCVDVCVRRHELHDASQYIVVVGEHNRDVDEGTETRHEVEQIVEHADYSVTTNDNDLALLKMKERIQFRREVSPACVAQVEFYNCYVTGWGKTHGERWMDGWVGGWVGGWVDRCVCGGGWVGGYLNGWMDGLVDGWMDGWVGI